MSNISLNYAHIIDPLSFKSINLAKIYIGEYGTLPNPAVSGTWKQAYFVNSDGTRTAASQPIRTNAAGFAVDGSGNIKTIQVDGGYSLLVQDQLNVTKFSQACSPANDGAVLEFDTIAGFTGALDGSAIFFKGRDTVGDGGGGMFRYSASSTQAPDGGTVFAPAGGGRLIREYATSDGVLLEWFGAYGNRDFDESARVQAALNSGASIVRAGDKKYLLTLPVTIPPGVKLLGNFAGHESPYKDQINTADSFKATTWVMRGTAQFKLSDNAAWEGGTLWYDQQNYDLQYDAGQPDGIEAWIDYPPAFEYIGQYSAIAVEKVVFLGGTRFFYAPTNKNPEKLHISRIYGYPLLVGVEVGLASDMTYLQDIHWNPNSMFQLPNYTPTLEKTAKYVRNMVPFKFGRVDGGFMQDCFVYACRDFIWLKYDSAHLDGVGGSMRMTNCAADVCHNFIRISQTQRGFGISAVNCWAVNNVNVIYDTVGGVVSRNPAVVRFDDSGGAALENAHVELVAFKRSPGRANAGIPGTGTPQEAFFFDNNAANDLSILCSACHFDESNAPFSSTFGLVSGLDGGLRRMVDLSGCSMRANQTDPYWAVNAVLRSNKDGTEAPSYAWDHQKGFTGGPGPVANFRRYGSDAGSNDTFGLDAVYKNAASSNKSMAAWRNHGGTRQDLLTVDDATGNVELPNHAWNANALVLGSFYIWVESSGKLRIKFGAPASDTDGTIVGTQS